MDSTSETQITEIQNNEKKRSLILSAVLSLVTPGLGHLYNGKVKIAILIPIIFLVITNIIYQTSLIKSFTFFVVLVVFVIITYIFTMIHSMVLAKHNNNFEIKRFNRLAIYILWPILFFSIREITPANHSIHTFRIPTTGMENTLKVDDLIMADMEFYTHHKVQRNDVVLFKGSKDNLIRIKRVIALGGEKIKIDSGNIFINGKNYKEDNPNIIYETDNFVDIDEFAIPENQFYLLGDNRPDSFDSREFGAVPDSLIIGKPVYIYAGEKFDRIGKYVY